MITRTIPAIAALLLAAPAAAQDKPAVTPPTHAEVQSADETLGLIVSAINSKEVPQETKNGLFGCLYENPLKTISSAMTDVYAKNKQLDAKNATQRLLVLAKICGAPVPQPKAAATPAGPKSEGR